MKVGFFGGSFDPPHRGHIALAKLAIERLGLDRVLIAPVGSQPLKRGQATPSPFEDRVAMLRLALAHQPQMEVSLIDAPRPDGRPNYTIDALRRLLTELRPDDQLYCIMGADSFLTIGKWHRSRELLLLCNFVVASRPGFDLQKIAAALPESISLATGDDGSPGSLVIGLRGGERQSRLYLLTDLEQDVSATGIRQDLRAGPYASSDPDAASDPDRAIDPAVASYIAEHRLYRHSG
jgi:nicotinate-nucleotide adenylyltransferase